MNESIVVSDSLGDDACGSDFPFPCAPFEKLGDLVPSEFPWTHQPEDAPYNYSPGQCLQSPAKELCLASTEIRPYTSAHGEYHVDFNASGGNPAGLVSYTYTPPGRMIRRSVDQNHMPDVPPGCFQDQHGVADEASPNNGDEYEHDNGTRDRTPSSEPSPTSPSARRPGRRTISSVLASASTSPAIPEAAMTAVAGSVGGESDGALDIKRHRERNRVAARKCRQKAKRNIAGLQRHERELSRQNKMLLSHIGRLREEVLDLKNEILRHAECGSGVIQNYIANAARRQV